MILTDRLKTTVTGVMVCVSLAGSACSSAPQPAPQADSPTAAPAATEPATRAPEAAEIAAEPPLPDVEPSFENPHAVQKWTGDLDGMIERRVIRVLTTYSKTTFFVDLGTQRGLVADAFHTFEADLNKKLKSKNVGVHVVFVPVAHDDLIPALLDGRGDVVAAQTLMTAWCGEKVDFTNATIKGVSSIIVTAPGVAPLTSVQDLSGKEVYLRASDISAGGVAAFNAELAKAGKPPVKLKAAPEVLADEDILEMVNAGLAPMTMVDDYIAEFWQQVFPKITLNKQAAVRTDGQTGMMVRKNSPKLLAELNAFLARYGEGSLERNVLLKKYLQNLTYAKPATAGKDAANFRQVVDFMRKYSDEYKLDYLLVAAQGYQESGLDQNRKSQVGAIGVMQLMPATGKDMNVGDIKQMDANIHAGVKYVRFMMDRYYAQEPMDEIDKGLFTFASYNAGPGRISQLRKRAEQRGLDRNKWFNNVEVIAAEQIGRETVQYVSNIYKYYLAYKMLTEQEAERQKAKGKL